MPTAAERLRTLVEGNSSALLVIPGLDGADPLDMVPSERTVTEEGDVVLCLPPNSPAVRAATHAEADELSAVLEITDVAPVAVAHRVRARAWVAGWLTPLRDGRPARLRLEVGEAAVEDLWGADPVEPDEFAAALPDPFAAQEAELLQHLAAAHGGQLDWLCALVSGRDGRCAAPGGAVPVALDRFGLRVRFGGDGHVFDARFDFPTPVADHGELRRTMHALFDSARDAAGQPRGEE
ncbi:DUF2470 domain-containing protein [Streptantibioticus rubrisoli]|uniref:DUF2470 domain-containing protein n=1 Tax=Streptantibioticus rubrisoli TaxID=1387313 RepID=A0ABT1PI85_9ACTN|nr:DUF2470 domain-containing protein [Streptantibioticus rubrisoli]MCQ4044208.1 DUF2470 domain-containing protein [Streptantibioticus rubrisoli]